jgi:hypothetical protein
VKASWGLSLETPGRDQRLRRLAHAFALPWVVLAIALRDATLRRAYLRTTLPISILTLALGAFAVTSPWTRSHFRHESDDDGRSLPVKAAGFRTRAEKLRKEATRLRAKPGRPSEHAAREARAAGLDRTARDLEAKAQLQTQIDAEDRDDDSAEDDGEPDADGGAARRKAAREEANLARGLALASEAIGLIDAESADADAGELPTDGGGVLIPISPHQPSLQLSLAPGADDSAEDRTEWQWPSLSALYGALAIIESVLLAFTRDHQHQIARQLCIETGGTPEHDEARPRVRVEWKWIRKKMRRKFRGTLILLSVWVPVTLLAAVPGIGRWLSPAAAALWGFYWLGVFTLGSTHLTWTNEAPEQPAFIRLCQAVRPVPLVGWLVGIYGRLWARLVRDVRPACLTYERASLEGAGLALARIVTGLPVINGFVRPVVPVASQLALRDRYPPPAKPAGPPE